MMGANPFEGDIDPRQVARMLRSTDRLAGMLQQEMPGMGATPAAIVADIINVQRADTKRLAEYHGVDIEVEMMSEQRAAELIAGVTDGEGIELVKLFNELARKRDRVLRDVLEDDQYEEFMAAKTSVMFTSDPDTFDDEPEV